MCCVVCLVACARLFVLFVRVSYCLGLLTLTHSRPHGVSLRSLRKYESVCVVFVVCVFGVRVCLSCLFCLCLVLLPSHFTVVAFLTHSQPPAWGQSAVSAQVRERVCVAFVVLCLVCVLCVLCVFGVCLL